MSEMVAQAAELLVAIGAALVGTVVLLPPGFRLR